MHLSFFEARFDFFDGISNLLANSRNEILDTTGITREYLTRILTTLAVPRYVNHCKNSILEIARREYQIKRGVYMIYPRCCYAETY